MATEYDDIDGEQLSDPEELAADAPSKPCSIWATATEKRTDTTYPVPGWRGDQAYGFPDNDGDNNDRPHSVVVLSLCDGIGAVMQALAQLNIKAKAFTSEILEEALRVTDTRHPQDTKLGDLTKITDEQLEHVVRSAQQCGHILFAAGTPCQDNTQLKGTQREGLKGHKSSLFHQVADTRTRLQKILQ